MKQRKSRRAFFESFVKASGQEGEKTAVLRNDRLTPKEQAARFLTQATLGADLALIQAVKTMGIEAWLDQQFAEPKSNILDYFYTHLYDETQIAPGVDNPKTTYFRFTLTQAMMQGSDLLRQRVALALSEIIVISTDHSDIRQKANGVASWYDMLLTHAFGNYRDLLLDVTLHPIMGKYLSHAGNQRADSVKNIFPDENFAREIMQLFTIGLFLLNEDGSEILDENGNPIPTYSNDDITEFAKVFTGLQYDMEGDPYQERPSPRFRDGWLNAYTAVRPMTMWETKHERSRKFLLNGKKLPFGQSGMKDINDALDNLFNHPNVGPFIGKQLIQRLVKSNPSAAYVGRVTAVFNNNGSGIRGDLKAVVKAILLDDEARNLDFINDPSNGKLREPFFRFTHLMRAFNYSNPQQKYWDEGWALEDRLRQYMFHAPSVFNFFSPTFSPAGPIGDATLVAPEFQLLDSYTAISTINYSYERLQRKKVLNLPSDTELIKEQTHTIDQPRADLSYEISLLDDLDALLDHLDLLLTYGTLSPEMRGIIKTAVSQYKQDETDKEKIVEFAIYLFIISPEYAIQV